MSLQLVITKPKHAAFSVRYFSVLDESEASFNHRMHLPDSHPSVMINLGAPLLLETADGKQTELPRVGFGGVQKGYLRVRATGTCHYVGLDMQAWGTRFLVDDTVNLVNQPFVPLGGIWKDFAQTLETVTRHSETEALTLFDQFVADLHQRKRLEITPVRTAMDSLYATNGQFSLLELASHSYLSPSQLERQFKYYVGVTPKVFARTVRLDAVLREMISLPARQMTHLAQRFDFTDQAHFIHEFKTFMNCTPSEFLAARSP